MSNEIKLKRALETTFRDDDSSWIALDVNELKPPLYSKAFILFLSLFFVTAVIYSAVTKVPVNVESMGRLANEKPAIPIRAVSSFTVGTVYVKENQMVKAGESLLATKEGLKYGEIKLLKDLRRELDFLNSKSSLVGCAECYLSITRSMKIYESLGVVKKNLKTAKVMSETGQYLALTYSQLKNIETKLQPHKLKLAQLTDGRSTSRMPASLPGRTKVEVENLRQVISNQYSLVAPAIQKLHLDLKSKIPEFSAAADDLMRLSGNDAPVPGKIINIRIKGEGEVIGVGQPLMEIVPRDNRLLAQIEVANRDIGSVKVGDAVELAIDAFPEMDYGVIKGSVQEILPAESSDGAQGNLERGFRVRVALDSQQMKSSKGPVDLLPGMTLRSRIQKKNETLLNTFYRTIFRMKDDMRARS